MQSEEETLDQAFYEVQVEIANADGLHMRPAMQFVDVASQFNCEISVSNGKTSVDGKSIMQMSMLAATCGTKLTVRAEGDDAKEAIEAIRELVEIKKFDEPAPGEKK
jgi:phosphocarrier protein